jgi:serine/threonine protein kinase/tetratricopeptide (TPR) repeat protein
MKDANQNMKPAPQREEALFQAAAQLDGAARTAFLDSACQGEAALRARLEALLAAHEQPAGVLAEGVSPFGVPPSGGPAAPPAKAGTPNDPAAKGTMKLELADAPDEAVGQKIGHYKILEKVGEGGCGVVYVAEQTEPVRRRVALKVIKLGMDTKQVVARFEAERQALAMMDHPNIAKVLDAGTTEVGRPYFVMELVRGIRITDYCDQNQLSTKERLELFIKICQAIQHAHQKGIIHRDIKPSNILVTLHDGVPVPKVIDFGIAKATDGRLTDATVYTQLHQFIGTPAYMSPEQAEMSGLDVDTRSDIYSLGVLLYELLTGKTPFDAQELMSQGIDAMRKTIREKDPVRPSTKLATLQGDELTTTAKRRSADKSKLMHQLKGDLDWIVMKCLEKDRTRRYETANGVAMDIKRHLNNEPVVARPPSRLYEFQKTVRRHKFGFAATGVIIIVLAVGVAMTSWQAVRATQAKAQALVEKERANREAATANRVTGFLQQMLATANPDSSKSPDYTVRAMLDDFARAIDVQFADNPAVAAELHTTIGKAYWNMQQGAKAKTQLTRALELQAAAYGTNSGNYADSLVNYAETPGVNASAAELEECSVYLGRALAIYHARGIRGQRVIHALWALQMIYDLGGKFGKIEALVIAAQAEVRQSPGTNYWELPAMNNGLIRAKTAQRKYTEAETIGRETITENTRLFGPDYIQTAWACLNVSAAFLAQSKYAEALEAAKQGNAIMRKRISPDQVWYGGSLGHIFGTLAAASSARALTNLFSSADELDKLESLFQERLGSKPLAPNSNGDPANVAMRDVPQFPDLYLELARELTAAGSTNEATKCRRKAATLIEQLQTRYADNPDLLARLNLSCIQSAVQQGDLDKAKAYCQKLLALKPLNASSLNEIAWNFATSAEPGLRDGSNAVAFAEQAVAMTSRTDANILDTLAGAYAQAGQFDKAVATEREAMSLSPKGKTDQYFAQCLSLYQSSIPYRDHAELSEAVFRLLQSGRFVEAEPEARTCFAIHEKFIPDDWRTFDAKSMLGGSLLGQKKYTEAEPLLLSGYAGMKEREDKIPPAGKVRQKEALHRIVQLYEATGQAEKAAEWQQQLDGLNPPTPK